MVAHLHHLVCLQQGNTVISINLHVLARLILYVILLNLDRWKSDACKNTGGHLVSHQPCINHELTLAKNHLELVTELGSPYDVLHKCSPRHNHLREHTVFGFQLLNLLL